VLVLPPSALEGACETAVFGYWPFGLVVWSSFSVVIGLIVELESADEPEVLEIHGTDGVEVQLVGCESGYAWAVIGPDLSLDLICVKAKIAIFTDPVERIRWRPMPLLSSVERDTYRSQLTVGLRFLTMPALPLYRPSRCGQRAMAVNVLHAVFHSEVLSLPTLRSPELFLGVLAALFVLSEPMVVLGVIEYPKELGAYTIRNWVTAKQGQDGGDHRIHDPRGRADAGGNKLVIEGMIARLDLFEGHLKEEAPAEGSVVESAAAIEGAFASPPAVVAPGSPAATIPTTAMETPLKRAATSQPGVVGLAVKRMRFEGPMPQLVRKWQLDEYQEIKPEEWNRRKPEGYRLRVSAEVLSGIYSARKTADAWARDFIQNRGLNDGNMAREVITAFAAVDTPVMTDRQKGLLNLVSFERLVRRACAIVMVDRNIHSRDDESRLNVTDESTIRVMIAEEEMKKAMGRDAQPMKEEMERGETANRSLLALRQLYRGSRDDSPLGLADCWCPGIAFDNLDGGLSRRVLGEVGHQSPPSTTPSQGAAPLRLCLAAAAAGNQPQSTFRQRVAELRRRSAGRSGRLPDRGETFPDQWYRVAPPPPGTRPASARSVSPRAAQKLEMFREEMLRKDGGACVQARQRRNNVDLPFRQKTKTLQLARRMALAGMVCRAAEKVDEVGLCHVAKKAEPVENEPEVTLRATPFLDVSEEKKEDDMSVQFGTCELPDFYYTVELGEELAPYFGIHSASGDALDALPPEGSPWPGGGPCAGAKVSLMGSTRACWTAQTTVEDLFHAGPQEYIDDFGVLGLGFRTQPGREAVATVEEVWLGAKELVVVAGFKVHEDACSNYARMIGSDLWGTRLAPNQDKTGVAVFGAREILTHKWELPDTGARVFADVHSRRMEFRRGARHEVLREVLREMAAAAAIAPLISGGLSTPWGPTVAMFDANLCGGALISTAAT
ncbi:unnamed protein product, partial [Prorocentrum cordatum]